MAAVPPPNPQPKRDHPEVPPLPTQGRCGTEPPMAQPGQVTVIVSCASLTISV